MKTKNNTLVSVLLFIIAAGCSTPEKAEPVSMATNHEDLLLTAVKDDDCFDAKMDYWFKTFNQLQVEGYDMYDANIKAVAQVSEKFNNCPPREEMVASHEVVIE